MNGIEEIKILEERLRSAELGPDPKVFEALLADEAMLDGQQLKRMVVEAHTPGSGKGQKFSKVDMSDFQFVDYGSVVVVTCKGTYEGPKGVFSLKFMRVWFKRDGHWQIIAGSTAPV